MRAGRLDDVAVNAVLGAAGHRVRRTLRIAVAGLSEREIEVLRLLARGHSMRAITARLAVSEKTVDNHIQHIYNKAGVSTRAGATLFAMEHDLLGESDDWSRRDRKIGRTPYASRRQRAYAADERRAQQK